MPTEKNRKWGQKTVTLPQGGQVKIRVVTEITFHDPVDRGQETTFTILNKAGDAHRDVHVDDLQPSSNGGGSLSVERIDMWRVLDPVDRGQETFCSMDNKTGSDSKPPHFSTHIKTHTTKFFKDGDTSSDSWIETEWIDEFIVKDPVNRGQETHYYVVGNPPDDQSSQVSSDDPDLGQEGSGGPPVRCDPYQNLVDFREKPPHPSPPHVPPGRDVQPHTIGITLFIGWTSSPQLCNETPTCRAGIVGAPYDTLPPCNVPPNSGSYCNGGYWYVYDDTPGGQNTTTSWDGSNFVWGLTIPPGCTGSASGGSLTVNALLWAITGTVCAAGFLRSSLLYQGSPGQASMTGSLPPSYTQSGVVFIPPPAGGITGGLFDFTEVFVLNGLSDPGSLGGGPNPFFTTEEGRYAEGRATYDYIGQGKKITGPHNPIGPHGQPPQATDVKTVSRAESLEIQSRYLAETRADIDALVARFADMPEGLAKDEVRLHIVHGMQQIDEWNKPASQKLSREEWITANRDKIAFLSLPRIIPYY